MAQKSLGYVELVWTCPNCKSKNLGSARFCKNCGASMPKNVKFEQPIKEEILTDKKKINEAKANPDIYCAYCGNRNSSDAKTCSNCGADLSEGTRRQSGATFAVAETPRSETIVCSVCGAANPIDSLQCAACGSPLSVSNASPNAPADAAVNRLIPNATNDGFNQLVPNGGKKPKRKIGCLIGGVSLFVLISALFYFLFLKTDAKSAQITNMRWESVVQELGLVQKSDWDWKDSIPSNALSVTECTKKTRDESDTYVEGAKEVCGAPYMVDRGNGYSEKVQDCKYEILDDYCKYTYMTWDEIGQEKASGNDKNPYYPKIQSGNNKKAGASSQSFAITLQDKQGNAFVYTPYSLSEYKQYNYGDQCVIQVNALGGITKMECN